MTALELVIAHAGNIADCSDDELAAYSKVELLEALCIYWQCLPTTVNDYEITEGR